VTISITAVDEKSARDFYEKNKNVLFAFRQQNGSPYQPFDEVKTFILQKLEEKNRQDARYALYKKLVDEEKVSFNDKTLEDFKRKILK
jgi:hypothetical protein